MVPLGAVWRSGKEVGSHKDEHAMGIFIGDGGEEMSNIQKSTEHFHSEYHPTQNDNSTPHGETYR